jgi:Domain of unknown function (DUF4383)
MILGTMLASIRERMLAYSRTVTGSPVVFGVWIMALWFTSNGPAAYLTCTSMVSHPVDACTTPVVFLPVTVNMFHTLCHLLTGIIGLVVLMRRSWAIKYAILCGVFYIGWGFLGVFGGEHIRHELGVDAFGSWVHVVEGSLLLAIWLGDRLTTRPADRTAATSSN